MKQVAVKRFAQTLRAGERTNQRNASSVDGGNGGEVGRRADRADQRKHLVLFNQCLDGGYGLFRLVAVITRDQLERATVDAAGRVHGIEVRQHAQLHAFAQLGSGTGLGRKLPDTDFSVGNADFRRKGGQAEKSQQQCASAQQACEIHRECLQKKCLTGWFP